MLCKENKCTGCSACANICPVGAIKMVENKEGFFHPIISHSICNNCGLCKKVCPIINSPLISREKPKASYAFWNSNSEIRNNSSSGGFFYSLADYIFNKSGVIYGAAYDENFCVEHIRINDSRMLRKLQTSKYVQSKIGNCFIKVKQDLLANKYVLFTGTPCQVAGLYGFLRKDYDKLITADFVCHGVPSPSVFQEYLKNKEELYNSKITKINFRCKTPSSSQGIVIDFENSKQYIEKEPLNDSYYWGFCTGVIVRNSCSSCNFIGFNKISDFTMGDFWGLPENVKIDKGLDNNPSLVFFNSEKANKISKSFYINNTILERSVEEAVNGNMNLRRASKKNKLRKKFFKEFGINKSFDVLAKKYLVRKKSFNDYVKTLLGPSLTKIIIKVFKL